MYASFDLGQPFCPRKKKEKKKGGGGGGFGLKKE